MDSFPGHSAYILILDGVQECLLIDSILMNTIKEDRETGLQRCCVE